MSLINGYGFEIVRACVSAISVKTETGAGFGHWAGLYGFYILCPYVSHFVPARFPRSV